MFRVNEIPLSLYIHLPWCEKKCPYCDFNSHLLRDPHQYKDYANALTLQLSDWSSLVGDRKIKTIYFGGGTPNLFPISLIELVMKEIYLAMDLEDNLEITFEVNPVLLKKEFSTRDYFLGLKSLGVNRLSVGVQSFDNMLLQNIGRVHDSEEIELFLSVIGKIFTNVNVDLMYGLPGQTKAKVIEDMNLVKRFEAPHISYYQLTIEPGTMFYSRRPRLPGEDIIWDMYRVIVEELLRHSYSRYEVSAYSREGMACKHNVNYWEFGDYIGIGAGAHSKITTCDFVERRIVLSNPFNYVKKMTSKSSFFNRTKMTPGAEVLFEYILNASRLTEGFKILHFEERTGLDFSREMEKFCLAHDKGLIKINSGKVIPTSLGFNFLTNLQEIFLPVEQTA